MHENFNAVITSMAIFKKLLESLSSSTPYGKASRALDNEPYLKKKKKDPDEQDQMRHDLKSARANELYKKMSSRGYASKAYPSK